MVRHAGPLAGGLASACFEQTTDGQCEAVLSTALDACERYYPAFQFVVWAGKTARQALDAAMFNTVGHA